MVKTPEQVYDMAREKWAGVEEVLRQNGRYDPEYRVNEPTMAMICFCYCTAMIRGYELGAADAQEHKLTADS